MITIRWGPDTCKCVFLVNEKFLLKEVENKCKIHDGLQDNACFNTILDIQKKINLMEWKDGETKEDHENRIWAAKEKALKEINKKKTKSK